MSDNIAVIGVHLGRLESRSAILAKELDELFRLYSVGKIKPLIGKTFPLEEAAAAHRYIHGRGAISTILGRIFHAQPPRLPAVQATGPLIGTRTGFASVRANW